MSRGPVRRLFRLFDRPPSAEDAVDLEIDHHLESRAEYLMEHEGLSREAALSEARTRFGNVNAFRRRLAGRERRHRKGSRRPEVLRQTTEDVLYAFRGLRKSPGLAIVVTLTLALGIGLNTAIFSVVKAIVLDPLPYPAADRLVWGYGAFSGSTSAAISPPDYLDYREMSTSFEYFGGRRGVDGYTLTGGDAPEIVRGQEVTAEFVEALGGVPILGRGFRREDEASDTKIVVLGHAFWQSHFGERPDVVGETIMLDGASHEVIGVLPAGFGLFSEPDFFLPIPLHSGGNLVRRFHNIRVVGLLKPGVSIEQAQAELDVIAVRLEGQYPETNATWRLPIIPLEQAFVGGAVRTSLMVLWVAVGLVLLIVCANVANLLLARGAGRRPEIAVRTALGAGRARIMRLLFTESLALAAVGCAAGIALAIGGLELLRAMGSGILPRLDEVALDAWVLAFAVGASMVTGLVFGLLPSLHSSRLDLASMLKVGGRGASGSTGRLRGALVVTEVAVSVVLLIGAGLLIQSFSRLVEVDPGFEPRGLVLTSVSLPPARYGEREDRVAFFRQLRDRLEAVPGVDAAAHGSYLPLTGGGNDTYVGVPGRLELGTDQQFNAQFRAVGSEYFDVLEIPILAGRPFAESERLGSPPVVLINQPFAEAIFPGEDPVGQRIQVDLGEPYDAEIIGVVGGVTHFSLASAPGFHVYLSYDQAPIHAYLQVVLRTSVDPSSIMSAIGPVVARIDALQAVGDIEVYQDVVRGGVAQPRLRTALLALFAGVALVLAVIGVYGVLSYLVAQRGREVGIRMALGAGRRDVVRMFVGRGLSMALAGLGIGLAAALGLTRFMSTLLYQVGERDLLTFGLAALSLAITAVLASLVPARRAARVDPTVTLRQE